MQRPLAYFKVSEGLGVPTVLVSGEVDLSNAPAFEERLVAAVRDGRSGLVVSMEDVCFCDTSGLRALIRAHRLLVDGHRLHVVLPKDGIRRVFNITHLDELFVCFDNFDAAVDSARRNGRSEDTPAN